ncbi:hypothetical protein ABGB14_23550 [Nonomuraea sp. B10E15]|uniref:hypothetical protein n=1 Tax=unclassified Nonomuraea TaxID=2593643 RepID=UPI00325CADE5
MSRAGLLIAGCGLAVLAAGTPASPGQQVLVADSSAFAAETGNIRPRGNAKKAGNYWSKGRSVNSGNFSNVIDSYRSNNSTRGSANNVNGPQRLVVKSGRSK